MRRVNFDDFQAGLKDATPPSTLNGALLALWHDKRGNWDLAHDAAQADESKNGGWVHAYLHRKEGDISNAGYWYSRAGKPAYSGPLDEEWESIARALTS